MGTTRFGSVSHAHALLAEKALGLEKDVRIVASGGTVESAAALKAGALDAVMLTFMSSAPVKFKGEIRELVNINDYLPKEQSDATPGMGG